MTLDDKISLAAEAVDLAVEVRGNLRDCLKLRYDPERTKALELAEGRAIEAAKRAAILLESIARDKRFTRLPEEK